MKEDFTYEYISINVESDLEPMYIDCYENFGWILIKETIKQDYYINANPIQDIVNLKFKRNRNIKNKEKLKALQQNCEKAFLKVDELERTPQSIATMYSLMVGFIAAGLITIAVFMAIKNILSIAILCGIIGLIGCIFPYPIYKKVMDKKEAESKNKIDEQYDIINNAYKEASKILLADE